MSRPLPANTLRCFPILAHFDHQRIHFYDQFDVIRENSGKKHGGVDIGGVEGTPIFAATSGRVPLTCIIGGQREPGAGRRRASGNYCVIVDGQGFFYYYFHMLNAPSVSPGDPVEALQQIGEMGNTGRAGHIHLHFQAINHLRNRDGSEQWYRDNVFPIANLRNLNPFQELPKQIIPGSDVGETGEIIWRQSTSPHDGDHSSPNYGHGQFRGASRGLARSSKNSFTLVLFLSIA
jgi:murein DD-endopeptidase MepM/ murein hydrolase activator NlpD